MNITYSISEDFSNGLDSSQLQDEIRANEDLVEAGYSSVSTSADECKIVFSGEPDEEILDGIISDHDPDNLEKLKKVKCQAINDRSDALTARGFEYPPESGKFFSIDVESRTLLLGMVVAKDMLEYPVRWNTQDQMSYYDVADATDVLYFYGTAAMTVKAYQDSGTTLKNAVRAATTKAEVDAVVDPR